MISGESGDVMMCPGSVAFPFEGAPGAGDRWIATGTSTGSGLSVRVAQLEPMGREILYVADPDAEYLRVVEHGSIAADAVGEPDRIGFSPDKSLIFDPASRRLLAAARMGRPT